LPLANATNGTVITFPPIFWLSDRLRQILVQQGIVRLLNQPCRSRHRPDLDRRPDHPAHVEIDDLPGADGDSPKVGQDPGIDVDLGDWPTELDRRFDRIVSAYVLHEFDLSTKVQLLRRLTERHLASGGCIVVGDIAFPTSGARDRAHRKWMQLWDEDEHYWAADEAAEACKHTGLRVTYKQVSSCGGVFTFGPGDSCQVRR
jgi:hypothetical protein